MQEDPGGGGPSNEQSLPGCWRPPVSAWNSGGASRPTNVPLPLEEQLLLARAEHHPPDRGASLDSKVATFRFLRVNFLIFLVFFTSNPRNVRCHVNHEVGTWITHEACFLPIKLLFFHQLLNRWHSSSLNVAGFNSVVVIVTDRITDIDGGTNP